MTLITRAQLAVLAPKADPKIAAAIADHADDVLPRYGLTSVPRLTDFMAHVLVESAYLTTAEENLNYSAARLMEVWKDRFPSVSSTAGYVYNPEALANRVYGGRMGNSGPNDGSTFRGRGLLQITGRDNFTRLATHLGKTLDETVAFITSDAGMLECAAATYVMLGAPVYADKGDITGSTRAINGGLNGLADRKAMLAKCQKIWGAGASPATTSPAMPVPANDQVTDIKTLQSQLASLGLYAGPVDGYFGPLTEGAVKKLQLANGLTADGVAGPKTWDALTAALAAKATPVAAVTKPAPIVQPVSAPLAVLPKPSTGGFWSWLKGKV